VSAEPSTNTRAAILDVGSNAGDFAVELARRNRDHLVLAVEPIASLAGGIEARVRDEQLDNVTVVAVAIDAEEGPAELNVATTGDWGVSSLLALNTDAIARDDYWSIRPDLSYTTTETVDRIRLETLLEREGIGEIDFVKLDLQGLDLLALESAGEALPRIRAGMLEVPTTTRVKLYADEQQDLGRAYVVLERLGFEVYAVKSNDPACNEVNVYFIRAGEDPVALEHDLHLRGVDLYDGKHYWAIPCSTIDELRAAEALRPELDRARAEHAAGQAAVEVLEAEVNRLRSALSAEMRSRRQASDLARRLADDVALGQTREALLRRELARAQAGAGQQSLPTRSGEVARLRDETHGLRHRVDELTASRSWRVTAPLRLAGTLTRRVVKRR
jgi:FkbM family methyltransferase